MRNISNQTAGNGQLASVSNALKILLFLRDGHSLRVTEMARRLGVGKSTAYRLLATLEEEGFVRRSRGGRGYHAGSVLYEIGIAAVGDLDVRRKARRPMEALSADTGETVNLLMLEGNRSRIIDGAEGASILRVASQIGLLLPANLTAGGKVLLSYLAREEVRALFPNGLPSITAGKLRNWEEFEHELSVIRRRGFAVNFSESEIGLHGVAVAVVDRLSRPVAALSLIGPSGRIPGSRVPALVSGLQAAALKITEAQP